RIRRRVDEDVAMRCTPVGGKGEVARVGVGGTAIGPLRKDAAAEGISRVAVRAQGYVAGADVGAGSGTARGGEHARLLTFAEAHVGLRADVIAVGVRPDRAAVDMQRHVASQRMRTSAVG